LGSLCISSWPEENCCHPGGKDLHAKAEQVLADA